MPTSKDDKDNKSGEVPATNVKAGFPGTTLASMKPDDQGAQPTQPPEGASQEGPSESSRPGPHGLEDSAEPLKGQPERGTATGEEEVVVRTGGPKLKK